MKHHIVGEVDVYAVGLLADLRNFVHSPDRADARRTLRSSLRTPLRWAKRGEWRAVKNHLNGYLCEPRDFPPGVNRCGTGWTRGRAYRDLNRQFERAADLTEGDPT